MERREISGLEPSLLGYGGMRYPLDRETKKIDREKAADLIRRAMEAGINYYDTAWTYHEGESESFLGQALKEYPRESYYLATKLPCWLVDSPGEGGGALSYPAGTAGQGLCGLLSAPQPEPPYLDKNGGTENSLPAGGVPAPGKNQKTGIFLSRRL